MFPQLTFSRLERVQTDTRYAFNAECGPLPAACEAQIVSPNGDSGAYGMASVMAHKTEEAISDPDQNAWPALFMAGKRGRMF